VTRYLHTMYRITDPERSRAFYEAGIEPERAPYSVREGGSRLCFVQDPDG
jgi:lactoylglutathione lyase